VTVVRDKKEEGHAVLTVTTDRGDYVLDNQTADILLWSRTGYRFVKRQSRSNLSVWVSLDDLRPAVASLTLNAAVGGSIQNDSGPRTCGCFRGILSLRSAGTSGSE
jgi:Bacterial transglutaminase-like cysteine proteinase BTLCP